MRFPKLLPSSRTVRAAVVAGVLALSAAAPQTASAQLRDDDGRFDGLDGRLRGYQDDAAVMPERSTALTYFAFIALAGLAAGVMFKASRRTHLD